MKVLFLTEGGEKAGFGHMSRCTAVSQAIEQHQPNTDIKFTINPDQRAHNFLTNSGVKDISILDWCNLENETLLMVKEYDVVIIDSYIAPKELYDKISKIGCGSMVMMDDYSRIEYPKGFVVNPSIYGDKIKYPDTDGVTYLLGKDYIILRKEFWDVPDKNISENISKVLVTFGGLNFPNFLEEVVSCLESKFNFDVEVVDTKKRSFNARQILSCMLKADLCVSGGGLTTNELARVGVPGITVYFAGNQRYNLATWHEEKVLEYIGKYNNKNILESLIGAVKNIQSRQVRLKRTEKGKKTIDGYGAKRMAEKIISSIRGNK